MRTPLSTVIVAALVALTLPAGAGAAAGERAAQTASSFTVADPPVRVLDTRNGTGTRPGAVPAGGTIALDLSPHLAAGTTAVVLNLTAVSPSQGTYVTVWPSAVPRPASSNLNVRPGEIRSISVTVPVGADGRLNLYNHAGNTHLVADLTGTYASGAGDWFNTVSPRRVMDTRITGGPLQTGTRREVGLAGLVPQEATSVVVNVTAVRSTQDTYLTVFEDILNPPHTSSVNAMRGEVTANLVTVGVTDGKFAVSNNAGTVDVLVDLVGYYSPAEGAAFHPGDGIRAYDSRSAGALAPGAQRRIPLGAVVPLDAETVLANVTGLAGRQDTFLTAFQAGGPRPATSTLNLAAGQVASNQTVVRLGAGRGIDVYNLAGNTHVIVDVFGYFAPRA